MSDKTFSNQLDGAQLERLSILMEEMGEALQVIGKIQRHGYDSSHPDNPQTNNRELLEKELGHVLTAIEIMSENADMSESRIFSAGRDKLITIKRWLHFDHLIPGS